ncbi:MAG TPA: LysM peptidoglycan-binding domain-containing protein [Gammaproteobacteria bacterium]|nr:LysM peptidoglycan-binding domain-containing protein [Gammaproteobacteria bacterium]
MLKPNVAFWRKVFGVWREDQVALHDMDDLRLVYKVVEIPGPVGDALTFSQRRFVREQRSELEDELAQLQHRVDRRERLNARQQALLARIIALAGPQALNGAADRVRTQRGLRERFLRGLEISGRYEPGFRAIFREAGLPADLAYLPHVESSFMPRALSSAGAVGMWQFTRATGRVFMQINRAVDERRDPFASARAAAGYLRTAYEALGSWPLAITSYNYGILGMMQAKERYGADFGRILRDYRSRTFGFASHNFYAEFLAVREIARDPQRYFAGQIHYETPVARDRVVLTRPMRAYVLAERYQVKPARLAALNAAWTSAAVHGRVPLPAGTTVWLPEGRLAALGVGDWASLQRPGPVAHPVPVALRFVRVADAGPRPARAAGLYHVVRRNETLITIARHYRMKVSTLRARNGIPAHDHLIRIGEKLLIRSVPRPNHVAQTARSEAVHVVRPGESPSVIAHRYGIRLAALLEVNDMSRRAVIYPGQRLEIPVRN